tara:strand:- start:6401 stop:7396 length:996 start_codon:yes stop_codon:yes gene_type:complete
MSSEGNELTVVVSEACEGLRADKALSTLCGETLSRSRIRSLIDAKQVRVNGDVLKAPSLKVQEGDCFVLTIPPPTPTTAAAEDIPLNIVYEDDDLLVVNKAVGMVVHPAAGHWSGTLVNALKFHCGDSLSGIGGEIRPGIVHRLDKDTSGLMLVAKNDHAHQYLSEQLADRSLSRVYHALVVGVPMPPKGVLDRPIGRHKHDRLKISVMSNALKDARTHYVVLERFGEACSLVECRLETGRTHQIRVHMEAFGHQLIGDKLYGAQPTLLMSKLRIEGYPTDTIKHILSHTHQTLHAKEISFIHPVTEERMSFSSELPDDFANILKLLEKET